MQYYLLLQTPLRSELGQEPKRGEAIEEILK